MSRSGYSDDCDQWQLIMYRGAVASAIRGKRGQAFLREMAEALDAMPDKCLITDDLERGGAVCAIGSVGLKRGVAMAELNPEQPERIAVTFGVSTSLVREIEWVNDEQYLWQGKESPEQRWGRVREWVREQLLPETKS